MTARPVNEAVLDAQAVADQAEYDFVAAMLLEEEARQDVLRKRRAFLVARLRYLGAKGVDENDSSTRAND